MVLPSVNRTITLAFADWGSKSCIAAEKAAAWLVEPEASSASAASLRAATEVISCVSAVAAWLKLTMPIRLPEPMASGAPPRLSDRSRVRTMSVGLLTISGEAESARVTCSVPSQSMRSRLICLLVLVTPMVAPSYARGMSGKGNLPPFILCAGREMGAEARASATEEGAKKARRSRKSACAAQPPLLRGKR